MINRWANRIFRRKSLLTAAGGMALLLAIAGAVVRINYVRHCEGVYLLKQSSFRYELTDDVMLGEEDRVVWGFSWDSALRALSPKRAYAHGEPRLKYEWFKSDGSGYVRNVYPDGREILTCFSRYYDSLNKVPMGLFVGGGLPYHTRGDEEVTSNDTGMAYYDGKRWYHLWCNVNEAISPASTPAVMLAPSQWEFLGSKVVEATTKRVVLKSSHRVSLDGTTMRIDRYVVFKAGEPYFILLNRIWNAGTTAGAYIYTYGDEPWVGNYGSSGGNIGWLRDRLLPYEGGIDPRKNNFAGMYDLGNGATGEQGNFTRKANFIEWLADPPDIAYFSNNFGSFAPESARVPLNSADNRVISLQWGARRLQPNEAALYILAIGMADNRSASGIPIKPDVDFGYQEARAILAN